jgi:hypothetical protein
MKFQHTDANGITREWEEADPDPAIEDVRAEAQRRIIKVMNARDFDHCLVKQLNALMRAQELAMIKASVGSWTAEQTAEAAALQTYADVVKAIRAASNVLEVSLANDYRNDSHWPQGA